MDRHLKNKPAADERDHQQRIMKSLEHKSECNYGESCHIFERKAMPLHRACDSTYNLSIKQRMRMLGIDYGEKKIGLAMGDTDLCIASPLEVWKHEGNEETLISRFLVFADKEDAGGIVVGIPKNSLGEDTKRGMVHRRFVARLKARTSLPVFEVDESFTSSESRRLQREFGSDVPEDALAAMLILEEYFSTLI